MRCLNALFLLYWLSISHIAEAKNSYIILSPRTFRPGSQYNITVNILAATGPVNVTSFFNGKRAATNSTIYISPSMTAYGIFKQGVPQTLTFNIADDFGNYLSYSGNDYEVEVHGSGGLTFNDSFYATYIRANVGLFIQTDRGIYQPGMTVRYNVFGVYPDLSVYKGNLSVIIKDPRDHIVLQIQNITDYGGMMNGMIPIDANAMPGRWEIDAKTIHSSRRYHFTVKDYSLPRFEVEIDLPPFGLMTDTILNATIKARYLYGQPVSGTVFLKMTSGYLNPVVNHTFQIHGEVHTSLSLNPFYHGQPMWQRSSFFTIEATITDDKFNATVVGKNKINFYEEPMRIEFIKSNPKYFRPGIKYKGIVKAMLPNGQPLVGITSPLQLTVTVNEPDYLLNLPGAYKLLDKDFFIPASGLVPLEIDIPKDANLIVLYISYGTVKCYKFLYKAHSPSKTFLKLSHVGSDRIEAGRRPQFNVLSTVDIRSLYYEVEAHQTLITQGSFDAGFTKNFTFSIDITEQMAPRAKMFVYIVQPDGEIVADAIPFNVYGLLRNKVSVYFSVTEARPKEMITIHVAAAPFSSVQVLVTDQPFNIFNDGNRVTEETLTKYMADLARGYDYFYGVQDTAQTIKSLGMNIATDALAYGSGTKRIYKRRKQTFCDPPPPPYVGFNTTTFLHDIYLGTTEVDVYPEPWISKSIQVGHDGKGEITAVVPDNNVGWEISALAVHDVLGIGVAVSSLPLKVIEPVTMTMKRPSHIIVGENLALQVQVYSKMTSAQEISVTLFMSPSFSNIITGPDGSDFHLQQHVTNVIKLNSYQIRSVYFPISMESLGMNDITVGVKTVNYTRNITGFITVLPEGPIYRRAIPVLIDLTQQQTFNVNIPLPLFSNDVRKLLRLSSSVTGDIISQTFNGVLDLTSLPTGCGEQTIADFATMVYVNEYLNATNQQTSPSVLSSQYVFIAGYERILYYQLRDGSFSFWRNRHGEGSIWLTAHVVKTLYSARQYITIDANVLEKAIKWIISKQDTSGAFNDTHILYLVYPENSTNATITLTAFVTIVLQEVEAGLPVTQDIVEVLHNASVKALMFLESHADEIDDSYALAVTSYALSVGGSSQAAKTFSRLELLAVRKDNMKFWNISKKRDSSMSFLEKADPLDIETAAYALLYYEYNNQQLTEGLPVLRWLLNQQNSNGGFVSTQDSVIAIQALSKFTITNDVNMLVEMSTESKKDKFNITKTTALQKYSVNFPTNTDYVNISASGRGLGFAMISMEFSMNISDTESFFSITYNTTEQSSYDVSVQVCFKLTKALSVGMTTLEFQIPSGYTADPSSIKYDTKIQQVDLVNGNVIAYSDTASTDDTCIDFLMKRKYWTCNLKPTVIKVYEYYKPEYQGIILFQEPGSMTSAFCNKCTEAICT